MNANVTTTIELARLKQKLSNTVEQLKAISNDETVVTTGPNWIHLRYVGRGSEQMQLDLNEQYSMKLRLGYLAETLARLERVLKDWEAV
ncbi:hypothetical protein [Acinetobacter radioresistens]|uniref:hypothetical protein n=1 Tax=Acinetobacter radioresistens TaxID=40216 RepID=UPI0032655C6C